MIKKKVSKTKKTKKTKSKSKVKKVIVKNPVYFDTYDMIFKANKRNHYLDYLLNKFVSIHSNSGISYGLLSGKRAGLKISINTIHTSDSKELDFLNTTVYAVKINFNTMLNRDDFSLIAEHDDCLGRELFWNEHDEFKKEKLSKPVNFEFISGDVDKVDIKNNRIYVRRLKQVKSK